MKKILFIIFFYFLLISRLFAYEDIYKSDFYTVNILDTNISEAKIKEIEQVKIVSFNKIIRKILTDKNLKKFKKIYDNNSSDKINYLIKNIIIEDEFITSGTYSAKIKVNFDSDLIIKMMRNNKIDYSDLKSPNILLIISEKNDLYQIGLSPDNSSYKKIKSNTFGLLNLIYPELSPNDQFILSYDKIISNNLKAFKKIASKYNVNYIFIANYLNQNNLNDIQLIYFDKKNDYFEKLGRIKNFKDIDYTNQLLNSIDNWWKEYNLIDSSNINQYSCFVKSSNIKELHYIYSKINILSQVESITLSKIILGSNLYDISFYGNLSNLSIKLNFDNIEISMEANNKCIISITN